MGQHLPNGISGLSPNLVRACTSGVFLHGTEIARLLLIPPGAGEPFRGRRVGIGEGESNMEMKHHGHDWRNTIWKIVSNPAFEVVAAIAVVMLATWIVVTVEVEEKKTLFPVPYDARR
jgi:hypothetical protein